MAKRSKTYNRLKPFIIETIGNTRARGAVSAGGSSGGGGGVTDHGALTGLADTADHPGFLLISGGRALEGNMAVNSGVTIDGVDISAHAADPDAHHDRVTVSEPLAISTQALSLTLGNGVETSAAALRVKLPTNSGLTRDTTGIYLAPSTLTVSTSNGVSGSGHTHGITASSDVGTTPAEALLKSNSSGALTLASLTAKGNVDITTGGDLTVGANILFADASQSNVGINCSPDPQFDLDVNGNLRATYIIGKHAIQLKGVLLLSHFDGKAPYETNFSGEPTGHMGQVATVTGGAIFRPGKFYKAAQIAAAVTNLCTNPSFETNATGYATDRVGASVSRVATYAYVGAYCLKWDGAIGSGPANAYVSVGTLAASSAYSLSAYIRRSDDADLSGAAGSGIRMYLDSTGGELTPTARVAVGNGWYRFYVSRTTGGTPNAFVGFAALDGNYDYYIDGFQVQTGSHLAPYCDGSLGGYTAGGVPDGSAHTWSGTAHASTSSRTVATLSYPITGNLSAAAGTVMAWVWVDGNNSDNACGILDAGSAWPYFALYIANGTTPTFILGNSGGNTIITGPAMAIRGWYHIAATWDTATGAAVVYTNGVAGTAAAGFQVPTLGAGINVGALPTLGTRYLNGLIDDLCILDRAAAAGEILSVYASDAPVFAETARFSFRATPKGLVWADDEGLWMRDAVGGPVLGAYGGEAASKSWASLTLAPGDVVLGDGASSYLLWDDSAGTLKLNTVSGADTAYMLLSGFYLDMYDASVRRFRFDGDLGKVTIGQVAAGKSNVYITDSYVALSVYTTEKVLLSATGGSGSGGYILVGETSSTSKNNIYIDADGLKMRQGTSITNVSISTTGVVTIGEVDTGKSNVQISSGVISLRNNTTSVITLRATAAADGTIASFDQPIGLGNGGGIYQGTGTFTTPTTGLKFSYDGTNTQIGVYNGGTLNASYGGGDMRFLITTSSTSTYNQLQFVKVIDTASIDTYYHSKLFGIYDSGNKRNTLYMRSYVNTSTDSGHQSRLRLEAFAYNGSTTTGPVFELYKDNSGSYAHLQTESFYINGFLRYANQGSNYSAPADGYCQTYVKGDKLVFQYTQSGTTNYLSIPLTGTGVTWTHNTSAP